MNLYDAKQLLAWMRAEGISSARVGEVALSLSLGEATSQFVPYEDLVETRAPKPRPTSPEDDPMTFDGVSVPSFEDVGD